MRKGSLSNTATGSRADPADENINNSDHGEEDGDTILSSALAAPAAPKTTGTGTGIGTSEGYIQDAIITTGNKSNLLSKNSKSPVPGSEKVVRGLRCNQPKVISLPSTKSPEDSLQKQGLTQKATTAATQPSYVSYLDDCDNQGSTTKPSYVSYILEDTEGGRLEAQNKNRVPQRSLQDSYQHPGAYTAAPGTTMDRVDDLRFSLFAHAGLTSRPEAEGPTPSSENDVTTIEEGITSAMRPARSTLPDISSSSSNDNNNNEELMEAIPVQSEQFASRMMKAEPIDQENLDQKATEEAKYKRWKRFGFGFVGIACLVLIVSLAIRLTNKNNESSSNFVVIDKETVSPTGSPTRPLPPMDNLDLLYADLPEKTRESLYHKESPQYQAWEWLLDHPNITAYPTWRKKQIFAMVTFYYSFEGPKWSQPTKSRWLNVSSSECSWVMTDEEVLYLLQMSYVILGPNAYGHKDIQPCNEDGRVQSFGVRQLQLPPDAKPTIPPEIELLTSLRMMEVSFSKISAKLSDLLIPELTQLPSLVFVNFHGSGIGGPIPKEISAMTNLRHFLIGDTRLTGTVPSGIAKMTSLEMFILSNMEGPNGKLPSQLGLLTSLTGLLMYSNAFTGQIPRELGLLTSVAEFYLDSSLLTGSIPSELGLMSSLMDFSLDGNHHLGGTFPSELGLLTRISSLRIGSNSITGSIPSELGLLTRIEKLQLNDNALTGFIPTELGRLTDTTALLLGNSLNRENSSNNFSGTLPSALWEFSNMESFILPNLPNLHGVVPREIVMPKLTVLRLEGSPHLIGMIPEPICFLQDELASPVDGLLWTGQALDFDCSNMLCGCDCECVGAANDTNPDVRHSR